MVISYQLMKSYVHRFRPLSFLVTSFSDSVKILFHSQVCNCTNLCTLDDHRLVGFNHTWSTFTTIWRLVIMWWRVLSHVHRLWIFFDLHLMQWLTLCRALALLWWRAMILYWTLWWWAIDHLLVCRLNADQSRRWMSNVP